LVLLKLGIRVIVCIYLLIYVLFNAITNITVNSIVIMLGLDLV